MFVADNLPAAEQEVNEWLQSVSAAVRHVSQSQCERNGRFVFCDLHFFTRTTKKTAPGYNFSRTRHANQLLRHIEFWVQQGLANLAVQNRET